MTHGRTDVRSMTPAQAFLHIEAIEREDARQRELFIHDIRTMLMSPADFDAYARALNPRG